MRTVTFAFMRWKDDAARERRRIDPVREAGFTDDQVLAKVNFRFGPGIF